MPLDGVIHKAAYKGDFGTVDDYLKRFPQDVRCRLSRHCAGLMRHVHFLHLFVDPLGCILCNTSVGTLCAALSMCVWVFVFTSCQPLPSSSIHTHNVSSPFSHSPLSLFTSQVNIPGAQNRTPLHRAIGGGLDKKQIVELLLAKKANPNLQDVGGLTPLHWAASFGYTQYGAMLIQAGATVDSAVSSESSFVCIVLSQID